MHVCMFRKIIQVFIIAKCIVSINEYVYVNYKLICNLQINVLDQVLIFICGRRIEN
jgi:hypothetical protein